MMHRHSFGNEALFVQGEKEPAVINSIITLIGHCMCRTHIPAHIRTKIINQTHTGRMV